jgi:hypothetical protein
MKSPDEIMQLIANGKTRDALDEFLLLAKAKGDNDLENSLILQKGRFKKATSDKNMYILTTQEYNMTVNQVNAALLEYLEDLPNDIKPPSGGITMPPQPPQPPSDVLKKILFLASNPIDKGQLQLDREFRMVSESLQDKRNFDLASQFATTAVRLQDALMTRKPQFVHFAGHSTAGESTGLGVYDEGGAGIYVLDKLGKAKLISSAALADLFDILSSECKMELVLLNACHSTDQAQAIGKHVPFVVGMSHEIPDETAAQFSAGFYAALADNQTDIKRAFRLGRSRVWLELGLEDANIMTLYEKGQKVIFD